MRIVSPEAIKGIGEAQIEFRVATVNNESYFADEYSQMFTFSYMTECSGVNFVVLELINP